MAKQIINIGRTANDRSGDPLRVAFNKVNENFTELYSAIGADVQIPIQTNNGGKFLTTNGSTLSWAVSGYDQSLNQGDNVNFGTITVPFGYIGQLSECLSIVDDSNSAIIIASSSDTHRWTFETGGDLRLPAGGDILDSTGTSVLGGAADRLVSGLNSVVLGTDGVLTVPGNINLPTNSSFTSIDTVASGTSVSIANDFQSQVDVSGTSINVTNNITNQQIVEGWTIKFADGTTRVANATTGNVGPGGEYIIAYDTPYASLNGFPITAYGLNYTPAEQAVIKIAPGLALWSFISDGKLQLPTGGDIVDSTGTSVLGTPTVLDGGNASTTF